MSRTVSNFVFAQRGPRKQHSDQGQSEVRENKKKAEKKTDAGATNVAAAGNAEADAEGAGGANAQDMAVAAEERKKAEKKEKREDKERTKAEKKKEVERSEKSVDTKNAEEPNNINAVVEDAQPDAVAVRAEQRDWVCVGDVSSNSRWQEDASETAAVTAEVMRVASSQLVRYE